MANISVHNTDTIKTIGTVELPIALMVSRLAGVYPLHHRPFAFSPTKVIIVLVAIATVLPSSRVISQI